MISDTEQTIYNKGQFLNCAIFLNPVTTNNTGFEQRQIDRCCSNGMQYNYILCRIISVPNV